MNEQRKAELARLVRESAKPARKPRRKPDPKVSVQGDGNIVGNNNTYIKTEKHINKVRATPRPGEEHITEDQVARLRDLKDEILRLEQLAKKKPATHQTVWASLNKRMNVGAMRMIPIGKFKAAEKYLLSWIGRLTRTKSVQNKDPDTVRRRRIAYIQTNMKQLGIEDRVRDYMERHYGVRSLKELPDQAAIERVYQYAGLK